VSAAAFVPTFSTGQDAANPEPAVIFVGGPAALDVSRAVRDAMIRLQDPACQRLLDDFTVDGAAVFVCGTSFQTLARGARANALIHEMLHTLGLRENPPSSAEITRRVTERCGS